MANIDEIDRKILIELQKDGSLSASEVAERVGLSQSPCWRRINRMEEEGIIAGRSVIVDRKKLGYEIVVFVNIMMNEHGRRSLEEFERMVTAIPEVQVVQLLLGEIDYRLRIVATSLEQYETILRDSIMKLPGVQQVQSSVMITEVKNTQALPL